MVGWLIWAYRPFETVFQSISGRLPERGSKKREMIERKNVQTTPTRTYMYCRRSRPLPYYNPNCRTPRYWEFTQDHRTTRPPPYCFTDIEGKCGLIIGGGGGGGKRYVGPPPKLLGACPPPPPPPPHHHPHLPPLLFLRLCRVAQGLPSSIAQVFLGNYAERATTREIR